MPEKGSDMDTAQSNQSSASECMSLCEEMSCLLAKQQEAINDLKLATYAVDAMRVLDTLSRHANMSKAFDETLKSICPDWRTQALSIIQLI
jgi:hypothetical protein